MLVKGMDMLTLIEFIGIDKDNEGFVENISHVFFNVNVKANVFTAFLTNPMLVHVKKNPANAGSFSKGNCSVRLNDTTPENRIALSVQLVRPKFCRRF